MATNKAMYFLKGCEVTEFMFYDSLVNIYKNKNIDARGNGIKNHS